MTARILLVDDDPSILEAFPLFFSTVGDLEVAMTAATGREALQWLETNRCDLVLSDIYMPDIDGIELLQHIQQFQHLPLFVAMTAFDTDEIMLKCLSLGAVGYVIKSQAPETIIHSLRNVIQGGTVLSPDCLSRLVHARNTSRKPNENRTDAPPLSSREHAVLSLICEGKTNEEIGKSMNLAEVTIRKMITSLFCRFPAKNRVNLAVKYQASKTRTNEQSRIITPQESENPASY